MEFVSVMCVSGEGAGRRIHGLKQVWRIDLETLPEGFRRVVEGWPKALGEVSEKGCEEQIGGCTRNGVSEGYVGGRFRRYIREMGHGDGERRA